MTGGWCRRWRSSATPTPASRRCSTRWSASEEALAEDRLFATLDPTSRDGQAGRRPERRRRPTRWASSTSCPISSSTRSAPPSKRSTAATSCSRWSTWPIATPPSTARRSSRCWLISAPADKPRLLVYNKADLVEPAAVDGAVPGTDRSPARCWCRPDRLRHGHAQDAAGGAAGRAVGRRRRGIAVQRGGAARRASASGARSTSATARATCACVAASRRRSPRELRAAAWTGAAGH